MARDPDREDFGTDRGGGFDPELEREWEAAEDDHADAHEDPDRTRIDGTEHLIHEISDLNHQVETIDEQISQLMDDSEDIAGLVAELEDERESLLRRIRKLQGQDSRS
jgi:predicted  nucleic acid-binding Zn-ribbon protein